MKEKYPISRITKVLNIKRRSYYKWISNGKKYINNYDSEIAKIISVEHKNMKQVYGTLRLKHYIESKYHGLIINHKKIRRYKNALNLKVIVRKKRGLFYSKSKEKNLHNKVPYKIECNLYQKNH